MRNRTLCCVWLIAVLFLWQTESRTQWIRTNGPNGTDASNIRCIAVSPSAGGSSPNLFAGTDGGVFLSTNDGASWTAVNTGLTNPPVRCFAVSPATSGSGTALFAGTAGGGVFLSTNNGASWTAVNRDLTDSDIWSFASFERHLFAGTLGGLFLSTNDGASWTAVNTGLTDIQIRAFAVLGPNLFAGTWSGGVFFSTDSGQVWTAVNTGLTACVIQSLAAVETRLFAGTVGKGAFRSTDNGQTWTAVNTGLTNTTIQAFAVSGTDLFACSASSYGCVFLYKDEDQTWTTVNTGLTDACVFTLAVSGTNLFAGTEGSGVWRRPLSEMVTSVNEQPAMSPVEFGLSQNYPNPFNPGTTIRFHLPKAAHVRLWICDLQGREVAVLVDEKRGTGFHEVRWDGRDALHRPLPSGVYLVLVEVASHRRTGKLMLLK